MAVYMPPLVRKKRVYDRYNPDTFRVISTEAENQEYQKHVPGQQYTFLDPPQSKDREPYVYNRQTQVLPKSMPDYRANRPHPEANDFLREDVLLLNEPICSVHTKDTHSEQDSWWPSRISTEPLDTPAYTVNSTYRKDFRKAKRSDLVGSRHGCNPNTDPALGSVPVNWLRGQDGQQRLWKEGLSYEQEYNCRLDPSYPIRGKRHGAFVWKGLAHEEAQRFIDYHSNLDAELTKTDSSLSLSKGEGTRQNPRTINVAEASILSWPDQSELPMRITSNHQEQPSSSAQDLRKASSSSSTVPTKAEHPPVGTPPRNSTETAGNLQADPTCGDLAPVGE